MDKILEQVENLTKSLQCPILLDLLEDPVRVPCCGKAFSRLALIQAVELSGKCPACNNVDKIAGFDVENAPKDNILDQMIEDLHELEGQIKIEEKPDQLWSASLIPVLDPKGNPLPIAQLTLTLEKAQFKTRPSLFLAVLDQSASMGGLGWRQVTAAMIHIMSLAKSNPNVKVVVIVYDSTADIVQFDPNIDPAVTIKALNKFGGTNFQAAFDKVGTVLQSFTCSDAEGDLNKPNNVGSVTIAFLTDGCDGSALTKDQKVPYFKDILINSWNGPVTVHSVGFTASCDKDLLEGMRICGNIEGTFRYAEPTDDDDALCNKLQGIFTNASDACSVKLSLTLPDTIHPYGSDQNMLDIRFPVATNKRGKWSTWVTGNFEETTGLILNSPLDQNRKVEVELTDPTGQIFGNWLSVQLDQIATDIFALCKIDKEGYGLNLFDLHCALIEQKLDAISGSTSDQGTLQRSEILTVQVKNLRRGNAVNLGRLADLRFGSQFAPTIASGPKEKTLKIEDGPYVQKPLPITATSEWKEKVVRYSHNNTDKNRNTLGSSIMDQSIQTKQTVEAYAHLIQLVEQSTYEDMVYRDINGNTPLMLASYGGHSPLVEKMLDKYPQIDIHAENNDKETALTLAIKKRGYWRIMKALIKAGATIQEHRKKALEQFCVNAGFQETAKLIASASADVRTADPSMQPAYIKFMYELAKEKSVEIDANSYLISALAHCMHDMVATLLKNEKVVPTVQMLNTYCIPPKPDDPETEKYLRLATQILDFAPHLIDEVDENEEGPLFKACEKGSRPHVEFFLGRGATVDRPNNLGNTPLWISCAKAYPCIIDILINAGADVNWRNLKGNVPMYMLCQKGPKKIVETLLANGAIIDGYNTNGDTLLLISCRNGQHEILELLLNYADPEFVDFRAHIDGFNCVFASVEANRPECIRVLKKYGANFEQKTDPDNKILANASPLHLAAYYGRTDACRQLISIGVNVNVTDHNDQTPLHFAVVQGHIPTIKLLRDAGAKIDVKDILGNTPVAYCRNRQEIRDVLVNPAIDPLIRLARGQFSMGEEANACELLKHRAGLIGCLSAKQAVDLVTSFGTTPLIEAIIHSNYAVAKILVELGADPSIPNIHGITGYSWAKWIRNARIIRLLPPNPEVEAETEQCLKRLQEAQKMSSRDAFILFLTSKPNEIFSLVSSGVSRRMEYGLSTISMNSDKREDESVQNLEIPTPTVKTDPTVKTVSTLVNMFNTPEFKDSKTENLVWNAKIFTTSLVASGEAFLSPKEIFALCLYTNNPNIATMLIDATTMLDQKRLSIFEPFVSSLTQAYNNVPPYPSEVYIGSNDLDRKQFAVGTQFSWPTFRSASTMWRVALDHVIEFNGEKKKQGTVFIVKSKTGRLLVRYSQFSYDGELLFAPNTQFKVTNWYRGDIICLGQENIREHTFKLKDEEVQTMMNSNKSLIIEIQEI